MDIQKSSGAKYTSGTFFVQCESSQFSSSTKTTFILHGLKICFSNQNILLCIIKFLPTNFIKSHITIWRWDQFQGYDFIIIRLGSFVEGMLFLIWFTSECLCCSKPIFEIKSTEYKTNIYTPMLSGAGGNVVSFGSLAASASPKISGGGFADYSNTSGL